MDCRRRLLIADVPLELVPLLVLVVVFLLALGEDGESTNPTDRIRVFSGAPFLLVVRLL